MDDVLIVPADVERLNDLVELWSLLHRHQVSVAPDIPGLAPLSEPASAAIVRELYREWLTGTNAFAFLAEADGSSVGYVLCLLEEPHFMWETGRVGHIDSLVVHPERRGQGLGRLLMEAAYGQMRSVGVTTVALDVVAGNDAALRFYERDGFTPTFLQMHRRLDADEQPQRPA